MFNDWIGRLVYCLLSVYQQDNTAAALLNVGILLATVRISIMKLGKWLKVSLTLRFAAIIL